MNEIEAVAGFAIAAVVTLVTTPLTARLAVRVGAIDLPRDRDLHEAPVPRLGGLAILTGILVAALIFMPFDGETRGILGGALVVGIVGAFDDLYDMPPALKLAGQVAAAAIPVAAGVRVEAFTLPFVGAVDLGATGGGVVTGLGMVAVMNVVNFTDGVTGWRRVCARSRARRSRSSRCRSIAWTRACSRPSPPGPRSGSSGTTSIPRVSSWGMRARTCSG